MTDEEANKRALQLVDKWRLIISDAIQEEYIVDDLCLGCGKRSCGGCPAGTYTGWNPDLVIQEKK